MRLTKEKEERLCAYEQHEIVLVIKELEKRRMHITNDLSHFCLICTNLHFIARAVLAIFRPLSKNNKFGGKHLNIPSSGIWWTSKSLRRVEDIKELMQLKVDFLTDVIKTLEKHLSKTYKYE